MLISKAWVIAFTSLCKESMQLPNIIRMHCPIRFENDVVLYRLPPFSINVVKKRKIIILFLQLKPEEEATPTSENTVGTTDLSSFAALANSDTPILLTGEDGTIYQVAGQNEDGQTILISQGPDGQQQCVLVASEGTPEESQPATSEAEAEQAAQEVGEGETTATLEQSGEGEVAAASGEGDDADGEDSQVVAQIIKADPPSPGKDFTLTDASVA